MKRKLLILLLPLLQIAALFFPLPGTARAILGAALFWEAVAALLWFFLHPRGFLHARTVSDPGLPRILFEYLWIAALAALCVLPMDWCAFWNGKLINHHNQYEKCAISFLRGQLHLDYPQDWHPLNSLDNPYEPAQRKAAGVKFRWDTTFFQGRYYMYFGVVPAVVVFVPYQAATGRALKTWRATRLFTILFAFSVFSLSRFWARRFSPGLSWGVHIALASATVCIGAWYLADAPSLYCTPIACGMLFTVLFLRLLSAAAFSEHSRGATDLLVFLGALCGALVFGCRPTMAMANLLFIPLALAFWRNRGPSLSFSALPFAAIPYIAVAVALMAYNAARFGNPLEFGQSYQLTWIDQTRYLAEGKPFSWAVLWHDFHFAYFQLPSFSSKLPWISPRPDEGFGGLLVLFPLLLCPLELLRPSVRAHLKSHRMLLFAFLLLAVPPIITFLTERMSPIALERYKTDFGFLLALAALLVAHARCATASDAAQPRLRTAFSALSLFAIAVSVLLFLVPHDRNISAEDPEFLPRVQRMIFPFT